MKNKVNFSFDEFHLIRKNMLKENTCDHVYFQTNSSVLISAPHGVSQLRLGRLKSAEIGTISTAVIMANATNSNVIIKTKNNDDDANFDSDCEYRTRIDEAIKTQNIKYLIDFHGLAKYRPCDINIGINFGQNVAKNVELFNSLKNALETEGFVVSIDEPFDAGPRTIAGFFAKKYSIWSVQIEINCSITNKRKNIAKCNKLLNTLIDWLERNY